jgi:hypothetical protein
MPKEKAPQLEQENRQNIDVLKEELAELNLAIALNTQATKGLKEVVERELVHHSRAIEAIANRTSVVETRLDNIDITLAKSASVGKYLSALNVRISAMERLTNQLVLRLAGKDGWSKGAIWALRIFIVIAAPCVGAVGVQVFQMIVAGAR